MAISLRLVLVLPLLAYAARAEAAAEPIQLVHVAAGIGAGSAYDGLGGHLALRSGHFGGYLGIGALGFLAGGMVDVSDGSGSKGFCAGLRWFKGDGEGLFISLNGTWAAFNSHYHLEESHSQLVSGTLATGSLTFGHRWRLAPYFIEASFGGGLARLSTPPHGYSGSAPAGARNLDTIVPIPDFSLGIGFEL